MTVGAMSSAMQTTVLVASDCHEMQWVDAEAFSAGMMHVVSRRNDADQRRVGVSVCQEHLLSSLEFSIAGVSVYRARPDMASVGTLNNLAQERYIRHRNHYRRIALRKFVT
jgi:hypothetical protein